MSKNILSLVIYFLISGTMVYAANEQDFSLDISTEDVAEAGSFILVHCLLHGAKLGNFYKVHLKQDTIHEISTSPRTVHDNLVVEYVFNVSVPQNKTVMTVQCILEDFATESEVLEIPVFSYTVEADAGTDLVGKCVMKNEQPLTNDSVHVVHLNIDGKNQQVNTSKGHMEGDTHIYPFQVPLPASCTSIEVYCASFEKVSNTLKIECPSSPGANVILVVAIVVPVVIMVIVVIVVIVCLRRTEKLCFSHGNGNPQGGENEIPMLAK